MKRSYSELEAHFEKCICKYWYYTANFNHVASGRVDSLPLHKSKSKLFDITKIVSNFLIEEHHKHADGAKHKQKEADKAVHQAAPVS